MSAPTTPERLLRLVRIDFAPGHRQPRIGALALATVVALVGSLLADIILVALGKAVFPSTQRYVHFQFHDYARLTIIGVLIACAAWPIVTRISSAPRWLFFRLAILVTIVLFAPDAYIWLVQGQSAKAVFVLIWLHVAIAIVTYNALVRLAPTGPVSFRGRHRRR
jgi:hypothetical protein